MRLPNALPPGGTIGIINPSSPVELERLDAGIAALKMRGFQVVVAPHVRNRDGHHAGSPAARAADFFSLYADPAIHVLWCARGGSSACRLWPLLDWDALTALPPKMVIGYSDTTSLLIPLTQRVGTVALHGPLIFELGHLAPDVLDWQLRLLQDPAPAGFVPGRAPDTLVPGVAEGALCGGCLSLVTATLGTPYQIDAAEKLLLIEDIGEAPPHRADAGAACPGGRSGKRGGVHHRPGDGRGRDGDLAPAPNLGRPPRPLRQAVRAGLPFRPRFPQLRSPARRPRPARCRRGNADVAGSGGLLTTGSC